MKTSERLPAIDSLRGLASLFVMIHHNLLAAALFEAARPSGIALWLLKYTPLQSIWIGRHAVMFFFVLSGFVLTRSLASIGERLSPRQWAAWIGQRSIRLLLPAFAALAISALLYRWFYNGTWHGESEWLKNYLWQAPPTPRSMIEQGLLVRSTYEYEGDNVLWSLAHEWRISIALPLLLLTPFFRSRKSALAILLLGLAVSGTAAGGTFVEGVGPGFIWHVRSTLYFILPFAVGAALEHFDIANKSADRTTIVCAVLALVGCYRSESDIADYVSSAIVIWLAINVDGFRIFLTHRALTWLGRISFSLYLVHELVIAPLYHQFYGLISPVVLTIVSCTLALAAAEIFYFLIERPVHAYARRFASRLMVPVKGHPTSA